MDCQVRLAITDGLRMRGVDVLTAQEDGREEAPDEVLLDRATALMRVLVTNDQDFLVEAARRQLTGRSFPGVIYAHQMRVPVGTCVRDLELIALAAEPAELADRILDLPLR